MAAIGTIETTALGSRTETTRRRQGGLAGLAFVALLVGQGAAASGVPHPDGDPREIADWLATHATEAMTYAYLLAVTAMVFVFFVVPIARAISEAGGPRDVVAAGTLCALGAVAVLLLCAVALIAAVYLVGGATSPDVLQALYVINTIGGNVAGLGWAAFAGSMAFALRRAGARPWRPAMAAAGCAGGVAIALCTSRSGALNGYSPLLVLGIVLLLGWIATASVSSLRGTPLVEP